MAKPLPKATASAVAAAPPPKIGHAVMHVGQRGTIAHLGPDIATLTVERDGRTRTITANAKDLRWSTDDKLWYLPGRKLARQVPDADGEV